MIWVACGFGVLTLISMGVVIYEAKTAPEMYFDKQGNLRRIEWFEENNKTSEMFYDEYGREPYDYEAMKNRK